MAAIGLIPWPLHQGLVYLAGVFAVLVPFVFDLIDGVTLPLFVATGVVYLAVGVLSRGPAGVAQVLPAPVHAGLVYLLGFFLVIAPFAFGFSDDEQALLIAVLLGLGTLVVSLLTKFPDQEGLRPADEAAPGAETAGPDRTGDDPASDPKGATPSSDPETGSGAGDTPPSAGGRPSDEHPPEAER
ncbi:hypothetical protein ER308_03730 [Egibacter rhizosphaerae]|uniref:SPW repeat-containing integral membrane domain-containing protein n=1 Tax=Egibacter rhizosphaerae TaxID=1670831 RepID=A0A411YC43_9ACTN|nr:SPW repeat protein [Egibacter rhizosphaerae]QBI18745.1 hypothetical protein ER308_03730 [Egibacter rhizosphaerae]